MLTNPIAVEESKPVEIGQEPTIALMSCGSLFEDFFDTIGISFETFCTELTGGWMFNYIDALKLVGVRTVLFFVSARVSEPLHFTHEPTGATIWVMPSPKTHQVFRSLTRTVKLPGQRFIKSLDAYLVMPLGLFAKLLQQEKCRAILFQDYENPSFDLSILLGQRLNIPVFATFQGGKPSQNPLEQLIRHQILHNCTGLIIGPQTEIERVRNRYGIPSTKIAQIFNPIDVKNWQAMDRHQARIALGLPLDARIVICHGRIDIHQKGLDILLEAWQQICRERSGHNLCLLLVGTGNDSRCLRQKITELELSNVFWVDEYIRDRVLLGQYISAADVYTLASRHEGFPVAPIEAMTCGLPVVAADAPGVPDILAGGEASGGLMVPRGDSSALAQALGRVLDDEALRQELGRRARCRVEKHFSLGAVSKHLYDFLLQPVN